MNKNLFIILFILFFTNSIVNGQSNERIAAVNYNKGLDKYNQKKYKEADSLFSVALKYFSFPDAFLNLALTRLNLEDKCGYCNNLDSAQMYCDWYAMIYFTQNCKKRDSINYVNNINNDSIYYSIIETETCSNKQYQYFFIKNFKSGKIKIYYIIKDTQANNNEVDYKTSFPVFSKIPSNRLNFFIIENIPENTNIDPILYNFITNNLKYYQGTKKKQIYGKANIGFEFEENGDLYDIRLYRGAKKDYDKITMNVIKPNPKFIPKKDFVKPDDVNIIIPVYFSLDL